MQLVITDLDGTLLDHHTYSFEEALPALDLLRHSNIPVVFCTSKTRAETELWRTRIGNRHPFIVENGGAVYLPRDYFPTPPPGARESGAYLALELGAKYPELVETLRQASARSGCRVRGFAGMTAGEVAAECGMSLEQARLAQEREYDEPFTILDPDRQDLLLEAIYAAGKNAVRGGRFHHIVGGNDKAVATGRLIALYRRVAPRVRTIGLGDGLNDAPFLNLVDVPILLPSAHIERLRVAVPQGILAPGPGPRGWNQALLQIVGTA